MAWKKCRTENIRYYETRKIARKIGTAYAEPDAAVVSALSADWTAVFDPASGKTYYFHRTTREARWEDDFIAEAAAATPQEMSPELAAVAAEAAAAGKMAEAKVWGAKVAALEAEQETEQAQGEENEGVAAETATEAAEGGGSPRGTKRTKPQTASTFRVVRACTTGGGVSLQAGDIVMKANKAATPERGGAPRVKVARIATGEVIGDVLAENLGEVETEAETEAQMKVEAKVEVGTAAAGEVESSSGS